MWQKIKDTIIKILYPRGGQGLTKDKSKEKKSKSKEK